MLYLFHGGDTVSSRLKRDNFLSQYKEKNSSVEKVVIEGYEWSAARLEELIGARSLFGGTLIISLSFVSEEEHQSDFFKDRLPDCAVSLNTFIFLEGKLSLPLLTTFKKYAEEVTESKLPERAKEKFNVFSLADALGRRDRRGLWTLFVEALRRGIAAEQIHGTLFWQVKMLLLSSGAESAREAGVGEFPFSNAKRFLKNFSRDDLLRLSSNLIALYHDARRGRHDFNIALEKFVLGI